MPESGSVIPEEIPSAEFGVFALPAAGRWRGMKPFPPKKKQGAMPFFSHNA
jgi:hypothetical protein